MSAVCISCIYLANGEISSRKCVGTDINICYFYPIITTVKINRHVLVKIFNVKFHENPSSRSRNVSRWRTERQYEVIFVFTIALRIWWPSMPHVSKGKSLKCQLIQKLKYMLTARFFLSYQEGESAALGEPWTLTVANLCLRNDFDDEVLARLQTII